MRRSYTIRLTVLLVLMEALVFAATFAALDRQVSATYLAGEKRSLLLKTNLAAAALAEYWSDVSPFRLRPCGWGLASASVCSLLTRRVSSGRIPTVILVSSVKSWLSPKLTRPWGSEAQRARMLSPAVPCSMRLCPSFRPRWGWEGFWPVLLWLP
jgi:hypothetical protein